MAVKHVAAASQGLKRKPVSEGSNANPVSAGISLKPLHGASQLSSVTHVRSVAGSVAVSPQEIFFMQMRGFPAASISVGSQLTSLMQSG